MDFEWDSAKAEKNERKHGIPFTLAASVFFDPMAWTFQDPDHSLGEMHYVTIGLGAENTLLVVSHVELAEERIRIISARRATQKERQDYEEG